MAVAVGVVAEGGPGAVDLAAAPVVAVAVITKAVDTKAAMMLMAVDMIPLTLMPPRVMVLAMMLMEAWECTNRQPQVMVHSSQILAQEAEEEGDTGPTRT